MDTTVVQAKDLKKGNVIQAMEQNINSIIKNFSPAWYASVMGTAALPLGALTIATGVVSQVTGCTVCHILYLFALTVFVVIWIIVAYKTMQNVISGNVFRPSH